MIAKSLVSLLAITSVALVCVAGHTDPQKSDAA